MGVLSLLYRKTEQLVLLNCFSLPSDIGIVRQSVVSDLNPSDQVLCHVLLDQEWQIVVVGKLTSLTINTC